MKSGGQVRPDPPGSRLPHEDYGPGGTVLLANHSLFRDVGRPTTAGVEVNYLGGNGGAGLWCLS